jgi:hypothetical protein
MQVSPARSLGRVFRFVRGRTTKRRQYVIVRIAKSPLAERIAST